jgi:hypothetical protein
MIYAKECKDGAAISEAFIAYRRIYGNAPGYISTYLTLTSRILYEKKVV